jgi:hypothetical protein
MQGRIGSPTQFTCLIGDQGPAEIAVTRPLPNLSYLHIVTQCDAFLFETRGGRVTSQRGRVAFPLLHPMRGDRPCAI